MHKQKHGLMGFCAQNRKDALINMRIVAGIMSLYSCYRFG